MSFMFQGVAVQSQATGGERFGLTDGLAVDMCRAGRLFDGRVLLGSQVIGPSGSVFRFQNSPIGMSLMPSHWRASIQ